MSNRNYVCGRNFEYRVIAYLRKLGYYCLRAYGSKGLYDVIAIPPLDNLNTVQTNGKPYLTTSLLIQAKSNGYVPKAELKKLQDNDKWVGYTLIAFKENRKLKFRLLNGEEVLI